MFRAVRMTAQRKGTAMKALILAKALSAGMAVCALWWASPTTPPDPHHCYGNGSVSAYINGYRELDGDTEYYNLTIGDNGTLNTKGHVLRVRGVLTNHGRITDMFSGGAGGSGGSGGEAGRCPVHMAPSHGECGDAGVRPPRPCAGRGEDGGAGGGGGGGSLDIYPVCLENR